MTPPKDYYNVLSLQRDASSDKIRTRFRELARERHPDRFQGEERSKAEIEFQEITLAFNVLSVPDRRRNHDLELSRASAAPGADSHRLARFHLEAGVGFYRDGNYYGASEAFEQVLRIEPKSHQAWHHLAQSLAHQPKYLQRSVEAVARACEINPMNVSYLKLAGRLHAEAGLLDKAERYYNGAKSWGGEDAAVEKALEELRGRMRKSKPGLFGRGS